MMQRARQLYRTDSTHMVFVTGTATSVREGSGTYVGISALREALMALGVDVMLIAPGEQQLSAIGRLWFNYRARANSRLSRANVVVGFDLDGVFIAAHDALDVACIKGVIAEELRFEKGLQRLSLWLQSYFEKRRVRTADRVLTTSQYAAQCIAKHYGVPAEQICIVPELIDLRRWHTALRQANRERRPAASILCVAHLYRRKDVATLLRAMARLKFPAVLRIVGVGPDLARLRRLSHALHLEGRVRFLEHVSFVDLVLEYRSADIFCLPSCQEGFGIVLLEAMAAGLPVVASRTAAIPETVLDQQCGLLVEPGDVAGFATALDELLRSPTTRQRLGRAGLQRAALYDAPVVAHRFLTSLGICPASS
jgi:glycosyltransferase involved in cell wall biosynthesis